MKFLDLFAGIGGFRRGMELAGHECVGFCECDKFAIASYTSMHCATNEQRQYLSTLTLKQRQKEILKDEYRNGEWYSNDIRSVDARSMPKADCWCFGFPCQDISVAGGQLGFEGSRSSLFFSVTRVIRELEKEDRPVYLLIENVKNLLSVNRGFDFAKLLIELDDIGYDAEWQTLNSRDFGVPQSRERVFIIGHLRGRGSSEIFPIETIYREDSVCEIARRRGGSMNLRTYDPNGICGTVESSKGGGNEPNVAVFCDMCYDGELTLTETARPLKARYYKGVANHTGQDSGVAIKIHEEPEDQGIVRVGSANVYATWSEKHQCYVAIRKLTPRECFRLQGFDDYLFDRAQLLNSDTQLYKQAGNSVTVNVVEAIANRME